MQKILLVICDGLGDRPTKKFGGKTPLEAAKTKNLDRLAANGLTGTMNAVDRKLYPDSDKAHLSIFGYPLGKYYCGRGPIEAAGIGLKLRKGDIALRANIATVDQKGIIVDRRAGRIESVQKFVKKLDGIKINGTRIFVKAGTGYRAVVVVRGKGLSEKVTQNDPKKIGVKPLKFMAENSSGNAERTAGILNAFTERAHEILLMHPENLKRKKLGLLEANYLLLRSAGKVKYIPGFKKKYGLKATVIAGAGMYKGIAKIVGMKVLKVKGATGLPNTNVKAKFLAAKKALKKFDFVFVHVKAADSFGEDGNAEGKKKFIEKIDRAAKEFLDLKNTVIAVTADHSTPCELKKHSSDAVPVLVAGQGIKGGQVKEFSERACRKGTLGHLSGLQLMPKLLRLSGRR